MAGILAWHFVGATLRNGDPVPPDGEWLEYGGKLEMCERGLHASRRLIDALQYSPGSTICRVRCDGEIVEGNDKLVCSRRKIVWRLDGEVLLRDFARWCARSVLHLWDAPLVVVQYLESGDEPLRAAARDAAWAAARAAAWAAAAPAAWAAAWDAAWDAARDAAWDAAWDSQNAELTRMVMHLHKKGS